jgi:hypothetical protein
MAARLFHSDDKAAEGHLRVMMMANRCEARITLLHSLAKSEAEWMESGSWWVMMMMMIQSRRKAWLLCCYLVVDGGSDPENSRLHPQQPASRSADNASRCEVSARHRISDFCEKTGTAYLRRLMLLMLILARKATSNEQEALT